MRILIKYTIKSMMEKKFRSFLIILAIALAGGLFLASSQLSDNIGGSYYDLLTEAYGKIDAMIYADENSPTSYLSTSRCRQMSEDIESIVPFMGTTAEYKAPGDTLTKYINIQAYNMEDYLSINKLSVLEGTIEQFSGAKLILTKYGAEQLGVKLGDELELNIDGKRKVTIVAIVDKEGMFVQEGSSIIGMMPFDCISKYLKTNNRAAMIYIRLKEKVNPDEMIAKLEKAYSKYVVEPMIDEAQLADQMSSLTAPFMLMTFVVVFMSAFIIYSSFKVIMLEKLPVVGTFRSVGATKGVMNAVLLLEAVFYGIIGGIGACFLGYGALYLLSNIMAGMLGIQSMSISMEVPVSTYMIAFCIGLVMAVLSTILPILSVSKISLKDIILNNRPNKRHKYVSEATVGTGLIVLGFAMAEYIQGSLAMLSSALGLFIMIIGMIKILPIAVLGASQVLGIVFKMVFGNIGELATKNIKKNSSVLNSITLITIGISVLFSISTMTRNVSDQVLDFYKSTFQCDIIGSISNLDNQVLRIIKRNENVTRVIEVMNASAEVREWADREIDLEGIQATQMAPDVDYNIEGDETAILKELQNGRNIIISEFLRKKYQLEIGDEITLGFDKDDKTYKIIAFMDTLFNDGHLAIVPAKYTKLDTEEKTFNTAYITVKPNANPEKVREELEESLNKVTSFGLKTVERQTKDNQESNAGLMGMISIFAILAMVIGIIGVINNLMISFIERRQSIAMLRSVGMSKWQVLKMIFIEGIGAGVISAVGGLIGGVLAVYMLDYVLQAMEVVIRMQVVPDLCPVYFIGGMLITIIGSLIPARGSSKLNIIEAIKYE